MGSTQRQRGYNPQNRNRGRGRGEGLGVVSWRGGRAGQVCYLRRGATGPAGVRNWPTVAGPMPRAVRLC